MVRANGNVESEFTPENPIANNIAISAPKSVQANTAHVRYMARAVREMIQLLVIGR
jgi:hypothetical protein